jgi:hypothetical protein
MLTKRTRRSFGILFAIPVGRSRHNGFESERGIEKLKEDNPNPADREFFLKASGLVCRIRILPENSIFCGRPKPVFEWRISNGPRD